MPTRTSRSDQNQDQANDQSTEDQSQAQDQNQPEAQSQDQPQGSSQQESDVTSPQPVADSNGQRREPTYHYDPAAIVRAELVRLGDDWQAAGALYQAIPAYTEVLIRYPHSGAAAAATEGLVNIARELKRQGRYYSALGIFRKLEALV